MTIGDKIKYCRTRNRLSQARLSELSGISLVSIKRYETNKAVPLPPQIKKLANALGIGALAFSETYFDSLQELETYGDLIRLLIIFRKNHLVQIDGERDESGRIKAQTAVFKLNPIIGGFFSMVDGNIAKDIEFCLNDNKTLENYLKWESAYYKYECLLDKYRDSNDESVQVALKENDDTLSVIELELQYDNRMLKRTGGRITATIPDYANDDALAADLIIEREKAITKELKTQKARAKNKSKKNDDK